MTLVPGIGGTLLPAQYLADALDLSGTPAADVERHRQHLTRWWAMASAECGPATGLRALFDLVAMPLFGRLGYRAHDAVFELRYASARLSTPGRRGAGLLLLPWSTHAPERWRDAAAIARASGAHWCFVVAPPHLSLVDARGRAIRRSLDVTLPDVLDARAFARFWQLTRASSFEALDEVVAAGERFQDRVRADLQEGVASALRGLEAALPSPPSHAPFDEALTIVYRVLFLLFAESRDLLPRQHRIYRGAYAIAPLCRSAIARTDATGFWDGLAAITRLSRRGGRSDDLIVKPFNGRLFARASAPSLEVRRPARRPTPAIAERDRALHSALLALGSRAGRTGRQEIHYADLGVEQLGAVYERVLDLESDPEAARAPARARPRPAQHSRKRKQTGTFYTPQSLAEFVVRRTLAPLTDGAGSDQILALRVVDPAMGSGAFLIAACRFLAGAYERALVDEGALTADEIDDDARADMRRLVTERCLFGVDANPVAVQVARLSLWLATLARGKPLSFLDHKLRVGNSLIGASPADLTQVPSGRLRRDRPPLPLFGDDEFGHALTTIRAPLRELTTRRDDTVGDVRAKETLWRRISADRSPLEPWRLAASVWCARWFTGRRPPSPAETRAAIAAITRGDRTLRAPQLAALTTAARTAAATQRFFHWPLEFPDVFATEPDRAPGFDAVIGNPPWEMLRGDHDAGDLVRFIRESGLYPHCDRGHLNLYQPFVERALALARPGGRIGLILPWSLASDDGAAALRQLLLSRSALDTIVGLDNAAGLFPIHRGLRFVVAVSRAGDATTEVRARFGVRTSAEIEGLPARETGVAPTAYPIRLTPAAMAVLGGQTGRWPDLRDRRDRHLLDALIQACPRLGDAEGWNARFGRELNATENRGDFGERGLPVYEGKHIVPFRIAAAPAAHLARVRAGQLLPDRGFDRPRLAYRDVAGVTNQRSLIAAILPAGCVTTHTLFCLRTRLEEDAQQFLCAIFNSLVANFIVRLLMGGHLTTTLVEDLPAPTWRRTREQLAVAGIARTLARGDSEDALAELEARVAGMYGLDRTGFARVLETFPLIPAPVRGRIAAAAARRLQP